MEQRQPITILQQGTEIRLKNDKPLLARLAIGSRFLKSADWLEEKIFVYKGEFWPHPPRPGSKYVVRLLPFIHQYNSTFLFLF